MFKEPGSSSELLFVLGRIVFMESLIANDDRRSATSRYSLPPGTQFNVCEVERLDLNHPADLGRR